MKREKFLQRVVTRLNAQGVKCSVVGDKIRFFIDGWVVDGRLSATVTMDEAVLNLTKFAQEYPKFDEDQKRRGGAKRK